MNRNALEAKNRLVANMKSMSLDSERAFFTMVHHEVENISGYIMNSEPAPFEGGWLALFAVFDNVGTPDFLFAMSNEEKNTYGIALGSDPSCPEWLGSRAYPIN